MKQAVKNTALSIVVILATVASVYLGLNVLCGNSIGETVSFASRAILEPSRIGAIAPSSHYLAQALCAKVPPAGDTPRRLLEAGAGTGIVTDCLVAQMKEGDLLDVVELDPDLAAGLAHKYENTPGVTVHACSITDLEPGYQYDAVVMGIPFNVLSYQPTFDIWQHCRRLAKPGSIISYFSYLMFPHLRPLFTDDDDQHQFYKVQVFLNEQIAQDGAGIVNVFANVPPARVIYIRAT